MTIIYFKKKNTQIEFFLNFVYSPNEKIYYAHSQYYGGGLTFEDYKQYSNLYVYMYIVHTYNNVIFYADFIIFFFHDRSRRR